ncbi:MAG: RidA family protein [Gemmatimonadales bacterium]
MTFEIINPESLGAPRGWNNGMLAPADGRILFVAGQVASDASGLVVEEGFIEQFKRALENVLAVVGGAGGQANHIGRLTIYVTDLDAYKSSLKPLGEAYRNLMGRHFPAMALVQVKGLLEPNAIVEIEATAVIPRDRGESS